MCTFLLVCVAVCMHDVLYVRVYVSVFLSVCVSIVCVSSFFVVDLFLMCVCV